MAGWGAVGVGGALLARVLHGREPNRFVLAAVCGLAGLAFGAWMDVYQWTLRRAPGPRHLPRGGGHLAALQPRARGRQRGLLPADRPGVPARARALPAPPRGALGALARADRGRRAGARAAARRAAPRPRAATPASRAERYLLRAQNRDGGFGAAPQAGLEPALHRLGGPGARLRRAQPARREAQRRALAGRRTCCAAAARCGTSARSSGPCCSRAWPAWTRGASAAATCSPRSRSAAAATARSPGFVSYTAFGVMALRASGASAGSATIEWLVSLAERRRRLRRGALLGERLRHDRRGAAGAGDRGARPRRRRRSAPPSWLRGNQNDDGGFGQFKGRDSNAQSTSYAVQGLLAAGAGGDAVVARAGIPRPPPAPRRQRRLLVDELPDARVGDRPGADGARGQAAAAGGACRARSGPSQARRRTAREAERPRRAAATAGGGKAGGSKQRAGAGGGAAAAGEPEPAPSAESRPGGARRGRPGGRSALAASRPLRASGAAEVKPVPVWAALLALAGLLALLWGLHRYVLPGRWPGLGIVSACPKRTHSAARSSGPSSCASSTTRRWRSRVRKDIGHIDELCRRLIAAAPMLFVATFSSDGHADVSPRGGQPGFVTVLDDQHLAIPDATGNRRLDTLENIVASGRVGADLRDPRARHHAARERPRRRDRRARTLLERLTPVGKPPQTAIVVEAEEVYTHCPKAFVRSKLWDPDSWPDPATLPDLRRGEPRPPAQPGADARAGPGARARGAREAARS